MALWPRVRAVMMLGYRALLAHPLVRLRRRGNDGPRRFLANYAPEGLVPLSAPEDAVRPAFMRCIGCGACDLVCPLARSLGPAQFLGPSVVALAWTRATPDLAHVRRTLEMLPSACGSCRACIDACPREVPLFDLFSWGNRQLARVLAAKDGR